MKQYCLKLNPIGSISRIPDAQTIFGAICNILIHTQEYDSFQKYIDSFNHQPLLIHSSMFPHGYLPMVHSSLFSIDYITKNILEENSINQLNYLQTMKQLKKIDYVSQKVFYNYILQNKYGELKQDLLNHILIVDERCLQYHDETKRHSIASQITTHVQKNLFYFDSKNDNDLYYNRDIYCSDDTYFNIYVKTELSEEALWNIFKYSQYFGFGPKHSSGKNSFKLIQIEEINVDSSFDKILLSKSALDNQYDLAHSHYQIESKLHQTGQYYLNNQRTGRFNLFKEGSIMKVKENQDYYGCIKKIKNNDHIIYYYAIGYVL